MKKYIISMFCVVITTSLLHASPDSDRIAQKLTNAAPRAFGSFRMFEGPVNAQGLSEWNAAINEGLDLFGRANKKHKSAQAYIMRISNANNDLVNSIKGMYNIVFGPAASEDVIPVDSIQARWSYKQQAVAVLERVQNDMAEMKMEIKSSKVKLAEKAILFELTRYIHNYAENAIASIDFKFTTDKKFMLSIPQDRPWVRMR